MTRICTSRCGCSLMRLEKGLLVINDRGPFDFLAIRKNIAIFAHS